MTAKPCLPVYCVALLLLGSAAFAETRYVNGNTGNDDGNDCLQEKLPCRSLGHAMQVADSGDVLRIADAAYTEALLIDKSLELVGESQAGTVIQAAQVPVGAPGQASTGTITIADPALEVTFSTLTIRHGNAAGTTADGYGGGIRNHGASLTLENVTIVDNYARLGGGGLYAEAGTLTLQQVSVSDNACAHEGEGGGISLSGGIAWMERVTINRNQCQFGGGMYLGAGGALVMSDSVFTANVAQNSGGALRISASSPVLTNVVFAGNQAGGFGGGLFVVSGAPTLFNTVFSGNRAVFQGGAIESAGSLILINASLVGNAAGNLGGAIRNVGGSLNVTNSVVWNNMDGDGLNSTTASIRNLGSTTSNFRNSLVHNCNPGGHWVSSCGSDAGSNLVDQDPGFQATVNPVNAPTISGNLRVRSGAPTIDAGDDNYVLGIEYDLDGLPRIMGAAVDLGAYEHEPPLFADRFEE